MTDQDFVTVKELWKRCPLCNGQAYLRWTGEEIPPAAEKVFERSPCHCGKTRIVLFEMPPFTHVED